MIKKLLFFPMFSLFLLTSAVTMAETTITVPDNYPKVVASGNIDFSNNTWSVDKNSYNIQSVLPIDTGEVYVVFKKPLPTDHPILSITAQSCHDDLSCVMAASYLFLSNSEIAVALRNTTANFYNVPFSIIVYASSS